MELKTELKFILMLIVFRFCWYIEIYFIFTGIGVNFNFVLILKLTIEIYKIIVLNYSPFILKIITANSLMGQLLV